MPTMGDEAVRSHVRAEFYEIRSLFLDRRACARVFDRERLEAFLLRLGTLQRCNATDDLPMAASDFDQFFDIPSHLEQEATYSHDQRAECAATPARWISIVRQFHLQPEKGGGLFTLQVLRQTS